MIIALVSKKGGVGKTTTAVNLSAALARAGRRVLLVDLDPNAGASLSLGFARGTFGAGAAGVLDRQLTAAEAVRPTATEGLEVIPASIDLRSFEAAHGFERDAERTLARSLERIREDYDHIFVDCPSSICLLTRTALAACDGFLVPAVPHFLALEGLEQLVATSERLRLRLGSAGQFLGIVLTMVDYRVRLTRSNVHDIRQRFGERVFGVEVRTNVRLAEAPQFGKNIFEHDARATGATAYRLLAEEVLIACRREQRRIELPSPAAWQQRRSSTLSLV